MSTLDLFRVVWGTSLTELVGPEPAGLEGELAPLEEGLEASRTELVPVVDALMRWLWSQQQFFALGDAERAELNKSVDRALRTMQQSGQARPALRKHRAELATFVRARLGEEPRAVTCAEYSAELQLQVLALTTPVAPILDVGCGPSANLVRHLRAQGLDATGIDRVVDAAFARAADWLTYDYGRYRTVLSHQAFSLHFLHHHHAQGDTAFAYARAYMAILHALEPGGVFAYAPGLPFIEGMVEGQFRVQRVPFAPELRVPTLVEVEQRTGLSFSYVTHVTRA
ncbi:MAG TPA: hypothetical protein VFX59_20770 [Polyangiales bacterium]|nr:hypothetical protein [Polyangiales bacterium]